jgi:L-asparaginase
MATPTIILHGGAGAAIRDSARRERVRRKLTEFADSAYGVLTRGNALEAAVHAVRLLEDDPDFNAGTGSRVQADGRARLSASVMDGASGRFAAVLNVENLKNPVLAARELLGEEFRVLAGEGAAAFALSRGFRSEDPRTREVLDRWEKWRNTGAGSRGSDTVGACALDAAGRLAAATSTGGRGYETPGRVSDSGTPAADFADRFSAVSATGTGEEILDQGLAVRIAVRVRDGLTLAEAFARSFAEARAAGHSFGAVGLDRDGRIAWETTTEAILYAWKKDGSSGDFLSGNAGSA